MGNIINKKEIPIENEQQKNKFRPPIDLPSKQTISFEESKPKHHFTHNMYSEGSAEEINADDLTDDTESNESNRLNRSNSMDIMSKLSNEIDNKKIIELFKLLQNKIDDFNIDECISFWATNHLTILKKLKCNPEYCINLKLHLLPNQK